MRYNQGKYNVGMTYYAIVCDNCGKFAHGGVMINGLNYCKSCAKYVLEDIIVDLHTTSENTKVAYTDKHIEVLEKQREERKLLKDILLSQQDELKFSEFYNKYIIKGGE